MTMTALLAATAVVALSAGAASAGGTRPTASVKHEPEFGIVFPHAGASVLYDQSEADNGIGIVSQNFESSFDAYDNDGADDFRVPAGRKWKITAIVVNGSYFSGNGPATSFNVAIMGENKKKRYHLWDCDGWDYSVEEGTENIFNLVTGGACPSFALKGGKTYWLSVQANMEFAVGGEWAWSTNSLVRGEPSVWENPGDGFATGCTTYTTTTTCIPSGEGGDFAFALLGKAK